MSRRGSKTGLNLKIHAAVGSAHVRFLRTHLIAAHSVLRPTLNELSLALIGDTQMAKLHESYLGVNGPTDVLTFELEEDARGSITSGEVVVCVDEARRQTRQRRTPLRQELLLYALHGMLHLSGFDDRTQAGYRRMHRKEDEILTLLGVGSVFAGNSRRRSPARSEVD